MSPEEHYAKAEELLEWAANDEYPERHFQDRDWLTARALAHATMALSTPAVSINVRNLKSADEIYREREEGARLARNPEALRKIKAALNSTTGDTIIPPAEEETKAEYPHRGLGDLTVLGPEIFTNGEVINWRGENFVRAQDDGICSAKFDGDRVYRCALADGHYGDHTTAKGEHWQKRPASSPVVPAPTETGPWQTWDAVPDHKPYHGTTENGLLTETIWVNKSGARHAHRPSAYVAGVSDYADYEMHNFAPFVAAEKEEA